MQQYIQEKVKYKYLLLKKEILREAAKIAKMRKRDTTQLQMIKYK